MADMSSKATPKAKVLTNTRLMVSIGVACVELAGQVGMHKKITPNDLLLNAAVDANASNKNCEGFERFGLGSEVEANLSDTY